MTSAFIVLLNLVTSVAQHWSERLKCTRWHERDFLHGNGTIPHSQGSNNHQRWPSMELTIKSLPRPA